ncbi:helix-turn-helix domain-containing protein [Streptomyces sp. NPDC001009]
MQVHDEQASHTPESALTELRSRLEDGLARAGLSKTQLAQATGMGRTTVSEAFQAGGPVPSARTVATLARKLRLPAEELLALRRIAAGESTDGASVVGGGAGGPGKLVGQWDPHELEVHPASTAPRVSGLSERRMLPGYVEREHDRVLARVVREAAQGRSGLVVLVGESSTGKTRACWEAVQPLDAAGWRLWHPFDPTRAEAALEELHRVRPRTVVWLNEAQHYLGDSHLGERIAAAIHALLVTPERGPVLILGTLWPDYAKEYTALPAPGAADRHSRVRELLAGRAIRLPNAFDTAALAAAAKKAESGDRLLADALTRVRTDGRLTQDLGGGPALIERYHAGSPAARAMLEAAMDARRLGVGLHLPQAFLTDAALDYLHDTDYDQLPHDWAEQAYAYLAEQVHGKQAPLRRIRPRPYRGPGPGSADASSPGPTFRLADYLEQHGRSTRRHVCPPTSFWHAAHTHLTRPNDLHNLTKAAEGLHRLQWAYHLRQRAADCGDMDALILLAWTQESAKSRVRQAANHGDTQALGYLARMRRQAGDREGAEALYRRAADHGDIDAMVRLAEMREAAGDREGAEALAGRAADHGNSSAWYSLSRMRERSGDRDGAEALARQATDRGDTYASVWVASMRESAGDLDGAETLVRQAADLGDTFALLWLSDRREKAGDLDGAECLAWQAADLGSTYALVRLAEMREEAGDRDGAETLARRAADHGENRAWYSVGQMREQAGDRDGAETLYQQGAAYGDTSAVRRLASIREMAGDLDGAECLARRAAEHGDVDVLGELAQRRNRAGDRDRAEALYRQVVDYGHRLHASAPAIHKLWPYGLDPDGTPTPQWQ